jgi:hypothetical protein
MERGYYKYTLGDLRAKARALKRGGLSSRADRRRLMFHGAVGGLPVETTVQIGRYREDVYLDSNLKLEGYARFVLEVMQVSHYDEKNAFDKAPDLIGDLTSSGWPKDAAAALVASFLFDDDGHDSKADTAIKLFEDKGHSANLSQVQKDALNLLLELDNVWESDAKEFMEAFEIERELQAFVLQLIDPPSLSWDEDEAVDKLLKAVETLERNSVYVSPGKERWAVYQALSQRGRYGLSGRAADFAENIMEYMGVSSSDVFEIMYVLKRDYEQELEKLREETQREDKDAENGDVMEALTELLGLSELFSDR